MAVQVRPLIGIIFYCLAALGLIFAFVFFMRMQEEKSQIERYRAEGTVSRAVVTDKSVDQLVTQTRRGRTQRQDIQVLNVRFVPKSPVKYADFPTKVAEADLPAPPPVSGDPMGDSEFSDVIWVSQDVYDQVKVGDALTVVDTIYSGDGPELHSDIRDWDPAPVYPRIAIALALALGFGLTGVFIGRSTGQ